MKIANYDIHTIITGRFALDGGAMFGVVPKSIWNKLNPADELNRIDMVTRSVLLISEDKKILIDTGMGSKWSDREKTIYKVDQTEYNLKSELAKYSLNYEDITDVILSHLHFDHTGGSTIEINGELKPIFPMAKYYCSRVNWNWANNPSEKDRASYVKENFAILNECGQLEIIDNISEFNLDTISFIQSDGHTKGMMLPVISNGNQRIIYCADLIPTSSHLALPFIMSYDLEPLKSLEEKRDLIESTIDNNTILVFEHDPIISACTIKQGKKYAELDNVFHF
jgi:glyoxylase-like metal-dependent hydrolase (beta-lactamase superfamily II)